MDLKLQANLRRERVVKLTAVVVTIATAAAIVLFVKGLLASLVLAFVINYLIAPGVNFLERKGVARELAITIPYVVALAAIGIGAWQLIPLVSSQAASLEANLPGYQRDFVTLVSSAEARFRGVFKFYGVNVSQELNTWILARTAEASTRIPAMVSDMLTVGMLAPFFAFFMLRDGRRMSRGMLAMVPNDLFELALRLHHQINDQLGGFIRARFFEAAIVGAVVFVGLEALSFPYAALLALFAALTNLIPYIGPIIGAVPAILIALLSPEPAAATSAGLNLILIASVYFIAQLIDVVFIIPLVVARIVNLHPVTVIIVIIVGAEVMGILGMMISIPVASVLKLTCTALYEHLMEFRT
jgi:putative permease